MKITPVPLDLNKLMSELWEFFENYLKANNKGHVNLLLDDSEFIDECIIFADPFRLRQILNNLLSNAIKFTEKGFIRIAYRNSEPDFLEFVVEDTGLGMKNDQLDIIFERFRQAELGDARRFYGGTGLGLTISRSLVQMKGGKMWVESVEGTGSTFYFTISYLPVNPQDIHILKITDNQPTDDKPVSDNTVLLVEPNYMKSVYYEKMILATGAVVHKVENMQQGYKVIIQSPQINIAFINAVVFENDDFSILRNIKKEHDKLPVALIISDKKEKYKPLLYQNLCKTVIQTPLKCNDFLEVLEKYARHKQ
jgi:hypothetical protein